MPYIIFILNNPFSKLFYPEEVNNVILEKTTSIMMEIFQQRIKVIR